MTEPRVHGEGRSLTVQLEVDLDSQPITGLLRTRQGGEEKFVGWLGFADALTRLHQAHSTERNDNVDQGK